MFDTTHHHTHPTAGILGKLQPADKLSTNVWHEVFDTNVQGVYNCARAVYPRMKAAGGGKIVIMSSIAGIRGWQACTALPPPLVQLFEADVLGCVASRGLGQQRI